jgi:MFS family permease
MVKIAILSVALVTMIEAGVSPALPGIAKAFPKVDISVIQLVVNMPGLLVIPASLLCGIIAKFISKRTLTIVALLLFLITSCFPALVNNFIFLLIMRALSGASCGLLLTLSAALIPDFYQGKDQKSMQGYKNAVANLGGIITSLLGGILATISWQATFWVFLIAIIPIILTIFFLPGTKKDESKKDYSNRENVVNIGKGSYIRYMIILCIGFFIYMVFYFGFYTNASFVIVQEHMGNSVNAGFVFTIATIGGVVSGIVFGKVSDIFKKFTGALGVGFMAICFVIFGFTKSIVLYYITSFFFGISFAMILSFVFVVTANKVSKTSTTMWFSILSCIQGLGGFCSSFILVPISRAIGGVSLYRTTFIFSAVSLIIGFIFIFIYTLKNRKTTDKVSI